MKKDSNANINCNAVVANSTKVNSTNAKRNKNISTKIHK